MTTRVLIVDDEESMRTLLRSWVEREGGSTVIEASTAEEGLEKVLSDSPAVALCDIRLPGEDGLWLAAQIRIHQPHTAVVMTTGVLECQDPAYGIRPSVDVPYSLGMVAKALVRLFPSALTCDQIACKYDVRAICKRML